MPETLEEVESAALQLEPSVRAELIRRLVRTLEPEFVETTDEDWLQYWLSEAERRHVELESGADTPVDGPAAMQRLKERYL